MRTKTLVVDANIARSAGESDECAKACRDTLATIEKKGHRLAMCEQLIEEWRQHAGRFAFRWLAAMQRRKMVDQFELAVETIRLKSRFPIERQGQHGIEDVHLLVLAGKVSKVVLAHDKPARILFATHAPRELRDAIRWSDPCEAKDQTLPWIAKGLPKRNDLLLSNHRD
jgi:hypothetical protein